MFRSRYHAKCRFRFFSIFSTFFGILIFFIVGFSITFSCKIPKQENKVEIILFQIDSKIEAAKTHYKSCMNKVLNEEFNSNLCTEEKIQVRNIFEDINSHIDSLNTFKDSGIISPEKYQETIKTINSKFVILRYLNEELKMKGVQLLVPNN